MKPMRSGDVIFAEASGFNIPVSGGVNNNAIFEMLEGESIVMQLIRIWIFYRLLWL